MIEKIIYSAVTLAGLGLIFGLGLAWASKKFEVLRDIRIDLVNNVLPGVNCGGCGYPGCMALAEAIAAGKEEPNACPVGGNETTQEVADIMGVVVEKDIEQVACVKCNGTKAKRVRAYHYEGIVDCIAANQLNNGPIGCAFGCLGMGTCKKVCQFDAILIDEDGLAKIDKEKCTACGRCIHACPRDVIHLLPKDKEVIVMCNSKDKGMYVKENCAIGCIGCKLCHKACKFDAIYFDGDLALIDYEKCTKCMECAKICPTKAIYADFEKRKKAVIIEDKCKGCTLCVKECQFDAIEGERKQIHKIEEDKCVGCSACEKKCPFDAIEMK